MRARLALTLVLGALAALLLPASALAAHQYLESFGPCGNETCSFTPTIGSRPVAIDQSSGNIYVANRADEAIFKFDEAHQPANFSALGTNEITGIKTPSFEGGSQLAVDSTSHRIYVTGGASANSLSAFEASGAPAEFSALAAHEITGFSELCGVAVDSNGDIYAGDDAAEKVTVFAPSGAKLTEFAVGEVGGAPESGPCNLAVDSSGVVYVNHWGSSVEKFTPSEFPVTVLTTYSSAGTVDPGPDRSLAVNPANDHLYVLRAVGSFGGSGALTEVIEYDAAGSEVPPPFGDSEPGKLHLSAGIAVKGSGEAERIYASDLIGQERVSIFGASVTPPIVETGAASEVAKTTARVEGTIDPQGLEVTECAFEYGPTESYGESAPCNTVDGNPIFGPSEIPIDSSTHTLAAHLTNLAPNTEYHFRISAENETAGAKGEDGTFKTFGPPLVLEESVTEASASSARINGKIDPRGEATTFQVEFVDAAAFAFEESEYASAMSVPLPAKAVGSGIGAVAVTQLVGGLAPGTTYHFRLVATNLSDPPVHGPDRTFATFPPAAPGLPDGRAYELVSPPAKAGEVFPPETEGKLGGSCEECLPSAQAKMPMQPAPDGGSIAYEGQAFGAGMAAGANEYLSSRGAGGWATDPLSHPTYRADIAFQEQQEGFLAVSDNLSRAVISQVEPPLAPGAPPNYSNLYLWAGSQVPLTPLITTPPPHRLAGNGGDVAANRFVAIYAGANAGQGADAPFTHVALEANDSLTVAEPGVAPPAPELKSATEHDLYEWSGGRLRLVSVLPGNTEASADAVIGSGRLLSPQPLREGPDFSHAISADGRRIFWSEKATGQLYLRVDGEETREVQDTGKFLTASADGSRVLLGDGCLYSLETEECVDLTRNEGGTGAHKGGFQGILGAAKDLSRIYFVDSEALTGEEESDEGAKAQPTKPNLYLWEEGATSFIATLLAKDNFFGTFEQTGDWRPSPSQRTAQVSGDGRYLTFMSIVKELIPGFDNSQREGKGCLLGSGSPACAEVYEYDATTAKLTCASCNPSGQRPLGYSNLTLIGANGGGISTFFAQPRNLSASGRLFFESQDALSPKDSNGHIQDVYEWEPSGVGDCAKAGGCLGLISSGTSPYDSQFLNATPSGNDAFIVTRQRLLASDKDDYLDLYDARVGGGIPEAAGAPCEGEGCRGPLAAPPGGAAPGSAAFSGPGNPPAPCRAGYVRKQGKCVKKNAKHKNKHHKKKRPSAKRAGGAR